jgi:hypothetical protein
MQPTQALAFRHFSSPIKASTLQIATYIYTCYIRNISDMLYTCIFTISNIISEMCEEKFVCRLMVKDCRRQFTRR